MSIIEIHTTAKCKDCKFFKREPVYKKDGSLSIRSKLICEKDRWMNKGERTIACDEFKPFWED